MVKNNGQECDANGQPIPLVKMVSVGSSPKLFAWTNSVVSFQFNFPLGTEVHTGRIDMRPQGELANMNAAPAALEITGAKNNYYLPHCPAGITGVDRWNRMAYVDMFPEVDLEFYSAPGGVRMALVCKPGFNVEDVYFHFTGQDSLRVDIEGALKLYVGGAWVELQEALAYQVDSLGTITELPWGGSWEQGAGSGTAKLFFGDYDPELPVVLQVGHAPMAGGGGLPNLNEGLDWSTSFGDDQLGATCKVNGAVCHPTTADLYLTGEHMLGPLGLVPGLNATVWNVNAWVAKIAYDPGNLDLDAKNLWTTYFGGNNVDFTKTIYLDRTQTNLYVGGHTLSSDLPAIPGANPNDGTYWSGTLKGVADGLLLKLSPGNGAIFKTRVLRGLRPRRDHGLHRG